MGVPRSFFLLAAVAALVSSADDMPSFTVQPASVVQKLGELVTLTCSVEPSTAAVSWQYNGQPLPANTSDLGVLVQRDTFIIPSLSTLNVGRYQCVARTASGACASIPASVTVAKLRDFEVDGQHEIEVDEGNTAVIECHLPESQPKAQVRYSVKQEWLESSTGNYLIMPSGNLQIVNATQEDEGTYKCAAYNPVTQEVKTSISTDRLRIRRSMAEAARIIYPPRAQTIIVTRGQSLALECVASGIPPPQVTWAKDGATLGLQNKTRFLLSNLLIDAISESDSGTYSCQADNGIGEPGAAFIYYSVQVLEPPEVVLELQQQFIPWGQSALFNCDVRGNPQPSVVWLHNASPLTVSQRHHITKQTLHILDIGPQDDGIYQCMAENDVGSSQGAARLITVPSEFPFKGATDSPTDVFSPVDGLRPLGPERSPLRPWPSVPSAPVSCSKGTGPVQLAEAPVILSSPRTAKADSYELMWRPRHDGGPPVLEYVIKHKKAGDPSDDWTVASIPGHLYRLTLVKLEPSSLYEVEMAARNCAGLGQAAMMTFRTGKGRSQNQKSQGIGASGPDIILNDDAGSSSQTHSQLDNARLSPPEAPDRPTISMASETSVYVTWIPRGNRGFPIQSFRVEYKKLKKGGDWVLATSNIPPSRLSVEIPGLEKGTSYKFRVRAVNILGESPPSAASKPYIVSGYIHRVYERPVTGPYITYTEAINETTIMLKWMYGPASNNNTPIHGFYIYYRPTDSDNDSDYKKDVVERDRYWHSITRLQPETSYDIKMQCFNEGGESEFSNVMICETKARRHPRPPVDSTPPQSTPGSGEVSTIARASDLPYLIVGVVLGAIVFMIVAFIPFCLWRFWAKQKHTSDLGFTPTAPSRSSCQYTMVPLRSVPLPNGHCPVGGTVISLNGGCHPHSTAGKPLEYCVDQLCQGDVSCTSLLSETVNHSRHVGYDSSERSPSQELQEGSFLPDNSTYQLLQTQENLRQPESTCHLTGSGQLQGRACVNCRTDTDKAGSLGWLLAAPVENIERPELHLPVSSTVSCSAGDLRPAADVCRGLQSQDLPQS
ncbi:brother of CDO isoform X1 [Erpetoichthys calabaricus]|uniref:Brother of CDO n=1 Tax=Erpetoichthys calabaricus TaxID=27687 RepID=A0A8C4RTZ1_ERPCA|nr:brother of CDO isoform X1 [Erpetoichthys calabaricus]